MFMFKNNRFITTNMGEICACGKDCLKHTDEEASKCLWKYFKVVMK